MRLRGLYKTIMDIEHLSKSQIVLLTLLVSFVTSIATGIVTVSLMGQAPPSVSQSVNRIIERTVEKVVPGGQAAAVITREKTVVLKESDLISQAVERVNPSVVRFYSGNSEAPAFLGLGVVIDSSGALATDSDILGENADFIVTISGGTQVRAFVNERDLDSGIAFLQSATTSTDGKEFVWKFSTVAAGKPLLGQTVISFAGKSVSRIADGLITSLIPRESAGVEGIHVIDTNLSAAAISPGSILANTDGEIIGMSTGVSRAISQSGYISLSALARKATSLDKRPAQ
jgi:hypothetical protein